MIPSAKLARCLTLSLTMSLACNSASAPPSLDDRAAAIDTFVREIGAWPSAEPKVTEGPASAPVREGDYRCVTRPVSETRVAEEMVAFDGNSEALWPGALLRGDAAESGLFTQIIKPRAPEAISVSLENLAGARSATIASPSLSTFRDSLSQILDAQITGATPANIYADIEEVHSEQQLALALGASVSGSGLPGKLAASFHFDASDVKSRYVVKYVQSYYTVDLDQPSAPSSVFGDQVTASDLGDVMGAKNPPVYVSSITYGRLILFTFESSYSADELGAALNFVYSGGAEVSGDVSVTYKDIVSSSNITAYILGGSGAEAAKSLGSYQELLDFVKQGGDYSRQSPGAPIAYKLAFLADNASARMAFTTDYERNECERVSQKVMVTLKGLEVVAANSDLNKSLQLYGDVTVAANTTASVVHLGRNDAVNVAEGASWPAAGTGGDAIVDVTPQPGNVITFQAHLSDRDPLGGAFDDDLGTESVTAPFEGGWRRDVVLHLTGNGSQVDVTLSLTPI